MSDSQWPKAPARAREREESSRKLRAARRTVAHLLPLSPVAAFVSLTDPEDRGAPLGRPKK